MIFLTVISAGTWLWFLYRALFYGWTPGRLQTILLIANLLFQTFLLFFLLLS